MQVMAICSSVVRRDNEAEGIEFFEAEVASSIRAWLEASSFKYWSRSVTKSVMPNWCMTEMSSTWSQVWMSQVMCLIVGVIELQVVNKEFMMMSRC